MAETRPAKRSDTLPDAYLPALELARLGFKVFPCRPGEKRPAVRGYSQLATADGNEVCRLWESRPSANVAIAGLEPGYLLVLDADSPEAMRELDALDLPKTATAATRKGRHVYLRLAHSLPY